MSEQHSPSHSPRSEPYRLEIVELSFLDNGPYSFHLCSGECLGISGPSGVGKTQLLRALADIIPSSGKVFCDGHEAHEVVPTVWRTKIVLIPADPVWWFDSVGEHLPGSVHSGILRTYLDQLDFSDDVLGWEISRLSTGERQRLGLLRGLLLEPAVLLLDEPTSGLDRPRTDLVEALITDYRSEKSASVVWVSHDTEQLERVADRLLQVEKNCLTVIA